jgi:hypothetical protein
MERWYQNLEDKQILLVGYCQEKGEIVLALFNLAS